MRVFVKVELGGKHAQPLQCQITEVVHLDPGNGVHPTDNLVEDSEMCYASDATAADHLCSNFVVMLTKRFEVVE